MAGKAPKKASAPKKPVKPSSRSKTGNSACSQAASNWQLSIRGKEPLDPQTYSTLAKCRAMNRTAKQADDRARMGYNLSDQGAAALKGRLQQRFDQGLITQKSRQERLKTLLAQRKEKQAGATAAPNQKEIDAIRLEARAKAEQDIMMRSQMERKLARTKKEIDRLGKMQDEYKSGIESASRLGDAQRRGVYEAEYAKTQSLIDKQSGIYADITGKIKSINPNLKQHAEELAADALVTKYPKHFQYKEALSADGLTKYKTAAQQKPAAPVVSATTENAGSKRLAILQGSLTKKEVDLNRRFDEHFADVRSANGQPLNDKRNGPSTMARWERQSDSIRSSKTGIEKTKRAIEREKNLIDNVNSLELPPAIKTAMESGNITQWRKHPNRFFVKGVEKGRIVYFPETGTIGHHYLMDIPKEQYPLFRDTYNQLRKDLQKPAAPAGPSFSLKSDSATGTAKMGQGLLLDVVPTALDRQVRADQAARGKALPGQTGMFDSNVPKTQKESLGISNRLLKGGTVQIPMTPERIDLVNKIGNAKNRYEIENLIGKEKTDSYYRWRIGGSDNTTSVISAMQWKEPAPAPLSRAAALVQSVRSKPGYGVARASAAGNRELVGLRMKEKNKPDLPSFIVPIKKAGKPPKPTVNLAEGRGTKDRSQYAKFLVSLPKEVRRAIVVEKRAERYSRDYGSKTEMRNTLNHFAEGRTILFGNHGKRKFPEDKRISLMAGMVRIANDLRSMIK